MSFASDFLGGIFGKKKSVDPLPPPPEFSVDPSYQKTQDYLQALGINILDGNIPDFYKGIGQANSPEFNNYLNLTNADIQRTSLDASAAAGRGGSAAAVATRAVGQNTTQARYADLMTALQGKEWLFGQGTGITQGVRSAGQAQQSQLNNYNLSAYDRTISNMKYTTSQQQQQDALAGQNFGQLLDLGINAGVGFATGGPVGAVAGAMGGVDWSSILNNASNTKGSAAPGTSESALQLAKRGQISFGGSNINLDDYIK